MNGVPRKTVTQSQQMEWRRRLRIPDGSHVLVYVGRMSPEKGPQVLVEALGFDEDQIYTVLAGDGPSLLGLREHAASRGLDRAVCFPGFVSQPEVLYSLADLTVVPSLLPEGLPLSVLESFNAGVPVVASDVAGTTDVVRSGVNGSLVQPGDALALRAELRRLTTSPQEHARLVNGARQTAEEFSEDQMLSGVLGTLREAAESTSHR